MNAQNDLDAGEEFEMFSAGIKKLVEILNILSTRLDRLEERVDELTPDLFPNNNNR